MARRLFAKVYVSAVASDRTRVLMESIESRAVLVGLWVEAARLEIGRRGGFLCLGASQRTWVTGAVRSDAQLKRLRKVCVGAGYPFRFDDGPWTWAHCEPKLIEEIQAGTVEGIAARSAGVPKDIQGTSSRYPRDTQEDSIGIPPDMVEIFIPNYAETLGLHSAKRIEKGENGENGEKQEKGENVEKGEKRAPPSQPALLPADGEGSRPKRKRRRLPETKTPDWLAPEDMARLRDWCEEKHPYLLARFEGLVEKCLDHHRSHGHLRSDWPASIRLWIGNEAEWNPESKAAWEKQRQRDGAKEELGVKTLDLIRESHPEFVDRAEHLAATGRLGELFDAFQGWQDEAWREADPEGWAAEHEGGGDDE